jgi:Protein of unknown function (DUF4238)
MHKKRHHYIAQTYLRHFCDNRGKVCTYSKDRGGESWFASPETIAFENRYYSQPAPDGEWDHNRLEDAFAKFESRWTPLVKKIECHEQVADGLGELLHFTLMHRVRVPTARDASERMLAEAVRMMSRHLYENGELPPLPSGIDYDHLDRDMVITIDPHRSIHAMADLAKGMARIFDAIGFEILQNETEEEFITSDNPVVYFDPTVPEHVMEPYNISRCRMDIELLFPITPKLILWGHTVLKDQFDRRGVPYGKVKDKEFVERINRNIARFAYRFVFARTSNHQTLVRKYARRSPVAAIRHIKTAKGRGIFVQHVFGKREPKPKWRSQ